MTVKPVKFPKVIDYIRFSFSQDKIFSSLRLEASAIFLMLLYFRVLVCNKIWKSIEIKVFRRFIQNKNAYKNRN